MASLQRIVSKKKEEDNSESRKGSSQGLYTEDSVIGKDATLAKYFEEYWEAPNYTVAWGKILTTPGEVNTVLKTRISPLSRLIGFGRMKAEASVVVR